METGLIKWFSNEKRYGFIQPEDPNEKDVFLHISTVERAGISELKEGQKVSYELVKNNRTGKLSADQLQLIP
ncbi:Cold shock protein CspG [Liberibacter crescens BT-1]|uniref:Cold shock protein CspG n=1 Tax=Liberibacter crescens (strain BT-1) TaxID=1215343 RepID=L0ESY5_LIBCB|nr:cold-shock protein [Liberibacter crescens]AGA64639.1 Cold shock protein CspG [Liberibacter crescens BT-1]AMC12752.1 cold-shock protein [Liberibacter crescens]